MSRVSAAMLKIAPATNVKAAPTLFQIGPARALARSMASPLARLVGIHAASTRSPALLAASR